MATRRVTSREHPMDTRSPIFRIVHLRSIIHCVSQVSGNPLHKYLCIALLSVLLYVPSSARADDGAITVEGLVTDSITGTALPGAIVTLHRSAEESAPIAFCQTDDRGMFSLSLSGDQKAKVCRVRLLGYKAQTIAIDSSDPLTHLVVRLARSSEQLPEVVVVGPPITHSGDTLTYRADA